MRLTGRQAGRKTESKLEWKVKGQRKKHGKKGRYEREIQEKRKWKDESRIILERWRKTQSKESGGFCKGTYMSVSFQNPITELTGSICELEGDRLIFYVTHIADGHLAGVISKVFGS